MAGLTRRAFVLAVPALLLAGCAEQRVVRRDGQVSAREFQLNDLAKSDVDVVVELIQSEQTAALRRLCGKLYRRNPAQWRKTAAHDADAATAAVFAPLDHWQFAAERGHDWQTLLADTWHTAFTGDRVASLMRGLLVMQMAAFDHRTAFYLWSELDLQKPYNAARNLETVAWALAHKQRPDGSPWLLSNALDDAGVANLSFEREFGKLIALNDALARILEDKTNRRIRSGVVNVASFVFLPL